MKDSSKQPAQLFAGLPPTGFLRIKQIVGDKKARPPVPPLIPVSASTFWAKVKDGDWPQPVKLSRNVTAWRVENIKELMESFTKEVAA